MATIEIRRAHSFTKDQAKAKTDAFASNIGKQLGLKHFWNNDVAGFEATTGLAKGAKGSITVSDKDLLISINLPGMLAFMKDVIEKKVKQELDTVLA